jgi:hypothetical protein
LPVLVNWPGASVCLALNVKLPAEAETVRAVNPSEVVLENPTAVRAEVGKPDSHSCNAVALKRRTWTVELNHGKHGSGKILQSYGAGEVRIDRRGIGAIFI